MSEMDAQQLALEGLAPRKRRSRASVRHTPAAQNPIASVVLDIQATHLGGTFDYLIDERDSAAAQPGAMVRVRFGGQRVNGIIWQRAASSDTAASALRYVERVFGGGVLVPESLRRDVTAIADAYGGTRANILRLAVPGRVAKVEKEQRLVASFSCEKTDARNIADAASQRFNDIAGSYDNTVRELRDCLHGATFRSFVFDPLPGINMAAQALAWMAAESLAANHAAVIVLPGMRETQDTLHELEALGLKPFAPSGNTGGWAGDVAVLTAALPPADRYRAWLAIATGEVSCVIGTRAAMYAPVEGPALFAVMDDIAYQQADGMMPYAQARGVLRLRANLHGGTFVALANARSPLSQWETKHDATNTAAAISVSQETAEPVSAISGRSIAIRPLPGVLKDRSPWIRWLNRDELARLADPSIGARVPHTAVANIRQALQAGPVLFSVPADGVAEALSCANPKCLRRARCPRCTGPLQRVRAVRAPRCRWCGAAAANWSCPSCNGERLRVVHVGAAGTAGELRGLFRGVPVLLSSPSQPNGVIETVEDKPLIVIATPGAEPRVIGQPPNQSTDNASNTPQSSNEPGAYAAVAILDAWNSLYRPGLDARVDTLSLWMRVASLCAPRTRGGQVLLLGETDSAIAQSLMVWDSSILASRELAEREATGMPPVVSVACVWGQRAAVESALRNIGAMDGDMAVCPASLEHQVFLEHHGTSADIASTSESDARQVPGEWPGMLGPVPIAQPRTMDARELEGTADRVKAVVRVPYARRDELARRLRNEVARHVASREFGELRFQLDPKDLI